MKEGFKTFSTGTLILFGTVIVVLVIICGLWLFNVGTADIQGRGNAHVQLRSAPYRIAAYDHFHNLCVAIQTDEGSLDSQFDLLANVTGDSQKNIVLTNISGLKAKRAGDIAQYNEDSKKDYTLAQFKDSDLPFEISSVSYDKKGVHTTCSAQ